ncbi:MAG: tyrosine-type recombinase/integrase [Terriglobales bacterium]
MPEFEIALQTGMRLSEQHGLRRDAINLKAGTLTVPPSKYGEARDIPLNQAARRAVETLQARSGNSEWAMVNDKGERMVMPRRWFETAVETAKLPKFTWHCLRHTFASRLVMLGVDLRTAQELMGHKDVRMTCRYAHLAPARKLAAVEKLDAWGAETAKPTGTRTSTGQNQ